MKKITLGISAIFLSGSVLAASTPVELTPLQKNIIASVLADDANVFLAGGNTMGNYTTNALLANVTDIAKVYDENQVAGDLKYLDKPLIVTGTVASINSGVGNRPYVVFKGKSLLGPQAHFEKSEVQEVATFKKGQEITLLCIGGGVVIGVPMLKKCKSTTGLLHNMVAAKQKDADAFLAGGEGSTFTQQVVALSLVAADLLPKNNECGVAGKECAQQLSGLWRNKKNQEKIKKQLAATQKQLVDAGLKLSSPDAKK